MSRFTPEMDRNDIQWEKPVGAWKEELDIVHLATIAENLTVPQDDTGTDLLNSIPTPWSRLLLFENALYNPRHPSHRDILDQWRGLLGLLALAKPLGLLLLPSEEECTINLQEFMAEHPIAKTFVDLRPTYRVNGGDVEDGKWEHFHLITLKQRLLGATSPRTLVFTAINHECPAEVPFKNAQGRLSDPLAYYKKYRDAKYLSLLKQWLDNFISAVGEENREMVQWMGTFPAAPKVTAQRRHDRLLGLLKAWRDEVRASVPAGTTPVSVGQPEPLFTWPPYGSLLFLPSVPPSDESDLLLATRVASQRKVLVCYRPDRSQNPKKNSLLYNQHGQVIQADPLHVCDGRWIRSDEKLPEELDFLPSGWEYISDPVAELFEDQLIEVRLPAAAEGADSTYALKFNNKTFLYPFKKTILNYFTPAELHQFSRVEVEPDKGYRVVLDMPLVKGRTVRAVRRFEEAAQELVLLNSPATDHITSELAMWPSFADPRWGQYYYFKRQLAGDAAKNLDFTPVNSEVPRSSPDNRSHWYYTAAPINAFVGSLGTKSGLLLPKYKELPPQGDTDYWKVAVDFGSTHTRVFYVRVEKNDDGAPRPMAEASIEPLEFSAYAAPLTESDPDNMKVDFFALSGKLDPPTRAELKTLLMQPVNDSASKPDWRPREGHSYMHWIEGGFDDRKLKADIKWEASGNKNDLRSYLRCLMVMVQAEALRHNATILFVTRSFPSAFSTPLAADHNAEWVSLGAAMGLQVESDMDKITPEAIATARYLVSKNARTSINTVSLDIGGSTTDIAVWYGSGERRKPTLGVQESVKMAAGIVGRYLQTDPYAPTFLDWFVRTVKEQEVFPNLSLKSFSGRRNGYALMFYNTLTYYELGDAELKRKFNALLGLIKSREEARGLLVHLIYLFGSLVYYSGLLARKVGLHNREMPIYYLYFCGKGGTLITWIDNHKRFVEKMFLAGLYGPQADDGPAPDGPPAEGEVAAEDKAAATPGAAKQKEQKARVEVRISEEPKQEVGRGLLVDALSQVSDDADDSFGLMDTKPPSVTVGETGYQVREGDSQRELLWSDSLDDSVLRNLHGELPAFDEMKELNHFINAVREAFKHQANNSQGFNFDSFMTSDQDKYLYIDSLTNRLLGADEGSVQYDLGEENNPNALVEPLLITEMKVLLESLSQNEHLFK
jgi:hypothetical protein